MNGYFDSASSGKDATKGKLRISVSNIQEFYKLIKQAEKELRQLNDTLEDLSMFDLEIDFSTSDSI